MENPIFRSVSVLAAFAAAIAIADRASAAPIPTQDNWCKSIGGFSLTVMEARQAGETLADMQLAIINMRKKTGVVVESVLHRLAVKAHKYPVVPDRDSKAVVVKQFAMDNYRSCLAEKPLAEEPEMFCMTVHPIAEMIMDRINLGEHRELGYARVNRVKDYQLRNYLNETVTLASQFPANTDPREFAGWRVEQCLKVFGGVR